MMTKQEVLDIILASPAGKVTERGFRKHFPEHYALLSELVFPDGFKFSQKIFHYLRDDLTLDAGRCGSCGKRTSFLGIVRGYAPFCSIACAMSNEGTKAKYKATCQKRYGVDNAFQSNGLSTPYLPRRFFLLASTILSTSSLLFSRQVLFAFSLFV